MTPLSCIVVALAAVALQLLSAQGLTLSRENNGPGMVLLKSRTRKFKRIVLAVRPSRPFADDDSEREHDGIARKRSVDRPTETVFDVLGPKLSPEKPKIVVLGATGRVGRLVVRQLLETGNEDMTIVALVRDYDKAIKVMYDDLMFAKKGPSLQIVQGNLVPHEELPGFDEQETEEEVFFRQKAESAARFYGNNATDYDNRELLPGLDEALESCITEATTIISCVGSVRPTNLWKDILARPLWRILKADVSTWCNDPRHPYYVNFVSTRKALGYAEREQRRREAAAMAFAEAEDIDPESISVPRIRFIRISDLCVGYKPWNFVPLVTNIIHSVVFRYQEMTEQLLDKSTLLETIVLRPGDLVDDERDVQTTGLQVSPSGMVPSPARVSREDVAILAATAATFEPDNRDTESVEPFHYTLGVRWVGEDMAPFPPQGRKNDGLPDAKDALKRALDTIHKSEARSRRRKQLIAYKSKRKSKSGRIPQLSNQVRRRKGRIQPHGICVALPVYLFLALFVKTMLFPLLQYLPGGRGLLLPALRKVNEFTLALFTLLIQSGIRYLPSMARRKQYIPF
eukprot:scaffold22592_cov129-Cylindrotheca_fusiformis.AAC.10